MSLDLLVPGSAGPSNYHAPEGETLHAVSSDVFNICERIKREVSPDVHVHELRREDGQVTYAINEICRDGVERFIFRTATLDGRVVKKLQYLMNRPLDERLKELEAMEFKLEAERKEAELDELYERVGRPMLTDLERCGFIDRSVSYPKRGIKK